MPLRRRPLCDVNQEAPHFENSDGELPPPPPPPPFYDGVHPALAQFMADTTRHFAEVVARIPQPIERGEHLGCSIRDFANQHFRIFDGTQGPLVAEAWITDLQLLLETIGCTDDQKVRYAGLKLFR